MCAIAGILSMNGKQDLGVDLVKMLKTIKHRGPDGSGIYINGKVITENLEDMEFPMTSITLGHNLLSIVGTEVTQPIIKHGFVLVANAEIYNYRELKKCYKENYQTDSDCEVIISVVNHYYNGSLVEAVEKTIQELDGDYAFAIYDGKDMVIVRDLLGVKPIYYGVNNAKKLFAFASERKALWNAGISNVHSLKPNHIILNSKVCENPNRNKIIGTDSNHGYGGDSSNKLVDKFDYKLKLKKAMIDSVKKRIDGLEQVGIIFSGGLDSTILAKLSKDLGAETVLYTVGTENSVDLKYAEKVAESLNLSLISKTIDEKDVRKYTELVVDAIEEFNIMKIGVGMPSYIASEMASKDFIKVMLSGQGADELFAGYNRYSQFYLDYGEKAQENLREDVSNLYHVNLQRDDAVTMANGVELRVPYLDKQVVEVGLEIPMIYKLGNDPENLRKCILRELARDLDVPQEAVLRPKKAAQYGSGVHKLLVKKVLKDENYRAKLESLKTNVI